MSDVPVAAEPDASEPRAPGLSASERGAVAGTNALRAAAALVAVTVAGSLVIMFAGQIVLAIATPFTDAPGESWFRIVPYLLLAAIALAAAWAFGHRVRVGREQPLWTATAFPSGFGAVTLILLPVAIAGAATVGRATGESYLWLPVGTLVVLFGAFVEELLLRGVLQPVVARAWGLWPALLLTAGSFMLMHVAGGWRDVVTLANIFLASVWFGLLAARTGGLLAPTLAHFAYNWSEELLFGATPNPGVGGYGALFDLDLIGGMRLGGSPDGMNASPILTLVLLLLIVIAAVNMRRRPRAAAESRERAAMRGTSIP